MFHFSKENWLDIRYGEYIPDATRAAPKAAPVIMLSIIVENTVDNKPTMELGEISSEITSPQDISIRRQYAIYYKDIIYSSSPLMTLMVAVP